MQAQTFGRQAAFSIQPPVRSFFIEIRLQNLRRDLLQSDTECVKIRKNMRLRQRIIALIGNLVYTLFRLFQPKANIVRKTVSVK